MEQALQTKEHFDLYGLHFDSDKATIQPESNPAATFSFPRPAASISRFGSTRPNRRRRDG
jgi:hypothetical protein